MSTKVLLKNEDASKTYLWARSSVPKKKPTILITALDQKVVPSSVHPCINYSTTFVAIVTMFIWDSHHSLFFNHNSLHPPLALKPFWLTQFTHEAFKPYFYLRQILPHFKLRSLVVSFILRDVLLHVIPYTHTHTHVYLSSPECVSLPKSLWFFPSATFPHF